MDEKKEALKDKQVPTKKERHNLQIKRVLLWYMRNVIHLLLTLSRGNSQQRDVYTDA